MKGQIKSVKDFLDIKLPNGQERSDSELESYVKGHLFDINKLPPEGDDICFVNGYTIGSRENIITITGPAKSRKTVICSAIASSLFRGPDESLLGFASSLEKEASVLHLDTEQGYKHYYYSIKRILNDAGLESMPERFTSVHSRDADTLLRIDLIEYLVKKLSPSVLFIDGVTDLIYDINAQEEAKKMAERLLQLSTLYKMLIVVVIHVTKATGFMTGAIGTALEKKSQTVIKIELDEDDPMVSHITCQYTRERHFDSFSIVADKDGKYSMVDEATVTAKGKGSLKLPETYGNYQHEDIIRRCFGHNDALKEAALLKKIRDSVEEVTTDHLSTRQASVFLKFYSAKTWLICNSESFWVKGSVIVPPAPGSPQLTLNTFNDDLPF